MSEIIKSIQRHVSGPAVVSLVLGLGIGTAFEMHTDEVAREKIATITTCKEIYPIENVVTEAFRNCIVKGVPNGAKIGKDKIKVGQPAAYIDAYKTAQENEQGLEVDRIALWGVAGVALEVADIFDVF